MIKKEYCDVLVLGAGPAGLAAALSVHEYGVSVLIVEREARAGGILKQCIHDGFGLVRFKEKLAGPEYARRFIDKVKEENIKIEYETFVSKLSYEDALFTMVCVNKEKGVFILQSMALISATGCRERSDRQVFIHGERPSGVFTAGLAQYFVNIQGYLPGRKCVILGSGDIGLIMARRLKLEGMEVEGVYEIKSEPSGLSRNIRQCLEDFSIPLHLSTTVTELHGDKRLSGVSVASVDEKGKVIESTKRFIDCDTLILSVGLIPENDLLLPLGLEMDTNTKGPKVDESMQTSLQGLYVCGNALHVNDLVDYVSASGEVAGKSAALFAKSHNTHVEEPNSHISKSQNGSSQISNSPKYDYLQKNPLLKVIQSAAFLSVVPQYVHTESKIPVVMYFRVRSTILSGAEVKISSGEKVLYKKSYATLRPPEMERIELDREMLKICTSPINIELIKKGE